MRPKINDLVGCRYNRLKVLSRVDNGKYGQIRYSCLCDCGNTKIIDASSLRSGSTSSCGCLRQEKNRKYRKFNESGNKYGRLTVLEYHGKSKHGKGKWLCRCV